MEALSLSFSFSLNALYHSVAIVFPKQLRSTLRTFASPKPVTASRIDASNVAAASGSGMASGSKGWIMSLLSPSLVGLLQLQSEFPCLPGFFLYVSDSGYYSLALWCVRHYSHITWFPDELETEVGLLAMTGSWR